MNGKNLAHATSIRSRNNARSESCNTYLHLKRSTHRLYEYKDSMNWSGCCWVINENTLVVVLQFANLIFAILSNMEMLPSAECVDSALTRQPYPPISLWKHQSSGKVSSPWYAKFDTLSPEKQQRQTTAQEVQLCDVTDCDCSLVCRLFALNRGCCFSS